MAKDQQCDAFGATVAGEMGQHLQDLSSEQVDQRGIHGRIVARVPRLAPDKPARHSRCITFRAQSLKTTWPTTSTTTPRSTGPNSVRYGCTGAAATPTSPATPTPTTNPPSRCAGSATSAST